MVFIRVVFCPLNSHDHLFLAGFGRSRGGGDDGHFLGKYFFFVFNQTKRRVHSEFLGRLSHCLFTLRGSQNPRSPRNVSCHPCGNPRNLGGGHTQIVQHVSGLIHHSPLKTCQTFPEIKTKSEVSMLVVHGVSWFP